MSESPDNQSIGISESAETPCEKKNLEPNILGIEGYFSETTANW